MNSFLFSGELRKEEASLIVWSEIKHWAVLSSLVSVELVIDRAHTLKLKQLLYSATNLTEAILEFKSSSYAGQKKRNSQFLGMVNIDDNARVELTCIRLSCILNRIQLVLADKAARCYVIDNGAAFLWLIWTYGCKAPHTIAMW